MLNNSSKLLFIFMLMISSLICISSDSWLGAWIGLEMNLLSFIPLMNNNMNSLSNEASLKYFLTQALASIILLFIICINFLNWNFLSMMFFNKFYLLILNSSLLLKIGAAPFHFWFPSIMDSMNWMNNLLLMTWQKINPFICISYCMSNKFLMSISLLSIIIGSLGGLNSSSVMKIMAYSSINHIGWMLMALISNEMNFWFYFIFYCFISISLIMCFNSMKLFHINQIMNNAYSSIMKFSIFISLLSMGGLPPFLGFLPKWILIENFINNNLFLITILSIMFTLMTLYFYMRMAFSSIILNNFNMYWKINLKYIKNMFFFNFLSMMFFPMIFFLFMT
uniref:NADH dehydrogenase subunit 2 n=1 Tax=Frontopsylla spadix TaxID=360618 RepID=UPI0024117E51|nr:NADH dehydrogenase subunit 2 [Frontopsylla spadix]YP_011004263.1 NADH dehydrogenase subunit 2 [Frontopsylla diqingensis]WEQ92364.1 NADH dehydrogenase subunit 2 [Frontopsylla spadix]WPS93638.1 NADH dehydrogenase subunit 2 [Frontopsylla diqingensis]